MSEVLKSNIAIDLGGKYTGLVSYTNTISQMPNDVSAMIINMQEQGSKMNYTVKDRTAVRHHTRAVDRFKKARKLIFLVISSAINRKLSSKEQEAIASLLKRRGYTRLETEIDIDVLKGVPTSFFAENLKGLIEDDNCLYDQFLLKSGQVSYAKKFKETVANSQIEILINSLKDKSEKKAYKEAFNAMKSACSELVAQEAFGHKHRKKYLEDIREDLKKDSRLSDILNSLGENEFFNCVGNISNLQQRALRWYFNDESMKGAPRFDNERFKSVWIRAYQFFHYPTRDERLIIKDLIKQIRSTENVIDVLTSFDPVKTIPPYEDQNNRRPPVDLTLLLNPKALDEMYGALWEEWTDKLAKNFIEVTGGLEEITGLMDRKSRLQNPDDKSYAKDKIIHSYTLQRLLDLAKTSSPITRIRQWSKDPDGKNVKDVDSIINDAVGMDNKAKFTELVQNYYKECEYAKRGLWAIVEKPLLELSDIHPPMKSKVIGNLVAGVLFIQKGFDFEKFKELWKSKVKGNSTLKSICCSIENLRKDYGNSFNVEYQRAIRLKDENGVKSLTADEKVLCNVQTNVELASDFIYTGLSLDELGSPKFANPYSLAQLYTIIETDPHGFSANCLAVTEENTWRMQSLRGLNSVCSRLSAESVKPFDGSLAKILDRQAYEIATFKANELKSLPNISNSHIDLGILVEANQFDFSASIAQIKKSKTAKKLSDKAKKGNDKLAKKWFSKEERIKNASKGICAYTGASLDDSSLCEIDHIIPRSQTKASMGTILNSEANLIYVTQKGNQNKKDRTFKLNDLHDKYLSALFKTTDRSLIRNHIDEVVERVKNSNPRFIFELMSDDEINCIRHALFMPGTTSYIVVTNALAQQYSTRVNGTQSWFVREIIFKLKKILATWLKENNITISFDAWKIGCQESQEIRSNLAKEYKYLEKRDFQPITSHAIDALCVFAAACNNKAIAQKIGSETVLQDISCPETLEKILPSEYSICNIEHINFADKEKASSRKLYKDGIYAENFIPVMAYKGKVKIGFDWGENCVEVLSDPQEYLNLISPYFKEPLVSDDKFSVYHVDKTKCFTLFNEISTGKEKGKEKEAACLQFLKYETRKKNVFDIFDFSKAQYIKKPEDKNFAIKLDSKLPKDIKVENKTLILPSKAQWKAVTDKFDSLVEKKDEINHDDLLKEFRKQKYKKSLRHKATAQVFSLPIIDGPSGGIRIKRQNYEGKSVYQLVAANTPDTVMNKGFASDNNGKLDWSRPVKVKCYESKNLTLEDVFSTACSSDQPCVLMSERKLVYKNGETQVFMAPGTTPRSKVYITLKFDDFKNCLNDPNINDPLDVKSDYAFPKDASKIKEFANNLQQLCNNAVEVGKPNGNLLISKIGEVISFEYTVSSRSAGMKSLYNQ